MGRSSNFLCYTCKTNYNLGYASYTSWLDYSKTLAEYDAIDSPLKKRACNKNFRKILAEHEDHDWIMWFEDYCSHDSKTDRLEMGGFGPMPVTVLAENFSEYEHVVMQD